MAEKYSLEAFMLVAQAKKCPECGMKMEKNHECPSEEKEVE